MWDLGSTAITSATASPETCSEDDLDAARFINDTIDNLVEESAHGEGDHLTAVLEIYQCPTYQHPRMIQKIRPAVAARVADADFATLEPVQRAELFYLELKQQLLNHPEICSG